MATLSAIAPDPKTMRPVGPSERILALDVIRGFAIAGVILAYGAWSLGNLPDAAFSRIDRAAAWATGFAIDGKFYTLLAFLFGYGFQLQLDRASGAEDAAARLYRRRLAVLGAIGFAHAILLRNGDILLPYAVTGFAMVPMRAARDRALAGVALVALVTPAIALAAWTASGLPFPERPETAGLGHLAANWAWVRYWYATAILNWPPNLTLFLFGLLAARHDLIRRLAASPALARRVAIGGLAAGAVLFAAHAQATAALETAAPVLRRLAHDLLFAAHGWAMAAGYGGLLLVLLVRPSGASVLRPLAALGRMALTNYLLQAAIIVPICLAFDLFDRFTPTRGLALAAAVLLLQVPFSLFWLRRFEQGPFEWLWRRATYGPAPAQEQRG